MKTEIYMAARLHTKLQSLPDALLFHHTQPVPGGHAPPEPFPEAASACKTVFLWNRHVHLLDFGRCLPVVVTEGGRQVLRGVPKALLPAHGYSSANKQFLDLLHLYLVCTST